MIHGGHFGGLKILTLLTTNENMYFFFCSLVFTCDWFFFTYRNGKLETIQPSSFRGVSHNTTTAVTKKSVHYNNTSIMFWAASQTIKMQNLILKQLKNFKFRCVNFFSWNTCLECPCFIKRMHPHRGVVRPGQPGLQPRTFFLKYRIIHSIELFCRVRSPKLPQKSLGSAPSVLSPTKRPCGDLSRTEDSLTQNEVANRREKNKIKKNKLKSWNTRTWSKKRSKQNYRLYVVVAELFLMFPFHGLLS